MRSFIERMRIVLGLILVLAIGGASLSCSSGRPSGRSWGGPEIVEGGVIFRYYDTEATKVYLVGDFNNWSPRADPMVDDNGDGEWTLFYPIKPGVYMYKFVVNGAHWIPDPKNPDSAPDGFEGRNSIIRVPAVN